VNVLRPATLGVAAGGEINIGKGRYAASPRHCFDQDILPLAIKVAGEDAETCCIATGLGK
jgi:hypothetical protein